METLTRIFQSIDYLIEIFSFVIALAGLFIAYRGYRAAGALIAVGSGLHAMGYLLLMRRDLSADSSALYSLLISTMYPGLLLLTVGICYLAYLLKPRAGA